jgi:hypothetical protein
MPGVRFCAIALVLLALAPAAWIAFTWRGMPQLGFYHDDGLYFVSARSLAETGEYRIASLPAQPWQTKYPPLFPTWLALVWKLNPHFPANLPLATLFTWLAFPAYLAAAYAFLREYGFSLRERAVLFVVAALNPLAVLFSASLMPELAFTALFVGALVLAERAKSSNGMMVLAGVLAGLAYLTRSAALPLLVTVPVCLLWRKDHARAVAGTGIRRGALFLAGMMPAVAAWQIWVATHLSHASDLVTLYYTDYAGFRRYNVRLADLPLIVWTNLDGLLQSIGHLLTYDLEPFGSKHLERVVAVAALAGCVRLARASRKLQYPIAAVPFLGLLLIWHYRPDPRLVFPLYPLLAAGLWTELKNVVRALQAAWRKPAFSERVAAVSGAAVLAGFAAFLAFTHVNGVVHVLPRMMTHYRIGLDQRRDAWSWIAAHTPEQASVLAYDDPLMYLYTGRRSCNLPIPPRLYYHNDDAGIDRLLGSVPEFAREQRLNYALVAGDDFYRDLHANGALHLARAVESSPQFRPLFRTSYATVYAFTPAGPLGKLVTECGADTRDCSALRVSLKTAMHDQSMSAW